MKFKAVITIPSVILAVAALAPTPIAWGHSGTASGTCNGGVTWAFQNYDKTVTNSITVTIDGTVRHTDPDMKASDAGTIATDKTVAHSWSVVVNAPGTQFDRNLSGSYGACVTVPTTTVAPTTTAPSTTVVTTTTASPTTSVPDVATTVVTDPTTTTVVTDPTTTTVVAVDIPPVPTTIALDVVSLVPAEPVLPVTGLDGTIVLVAAILVIGGVFLVLRGRRVG